MTKLAVSFLDFTFPTPLVLASGIWGTTVSLLTRAAAAGCGAVTAKSCGPTPRAGHVNPSCLDWGHGLINAIGLANPGAEAEVELLRRAKGELAAARRPLDCQHLRRSARGVRHGGADGGPGCPGPDRSQYLLSQCPQRIWRTLRRLTRGSGGGDGDRQGCSAREQGFP